MRPTNNNIQLEPLDKPVSKLLFLPPKYERRAKEFLSGRVVAVGPKMFSLKKGKEIAYAKDRGIEVEYNGKRYVFIKPSHILAIE